ncbi:MAG: hypothetical protein AAGA19_01370 [Pseudomonadota bacterium]
MKYPTILGAHFGALVAFALSKGMSMDDVQAVSGLAPGEILNPEARVPETRMAGLWNELFRRFVRGGNLRTSYRLEGHNECSLPEGLGG